MSKRWTLESNKIVAIKTVKYDKEIVSREPADCAMVLVKPASFGELVIVVAWPGWPSVMRRGGGITTYAGKRFPIAWTETISTRL